MTEPAGFEGIRQRRQKRSGDASAEATPQRRQSYISPQPNSQLSRAEKRRRGRRRRLERRMERHYRTESPLVTRLKQIALTLFLLVGGALIFYSLFFYK